MKLCDCCSKRIMEKEKLYKFTLETDNKGGGYNQNFCKECTDIIEQVLKGSLKCTLFLKRFKFATALFKATTVRHRNDIIDRFTDTEYIDKNY